MSDEKVLGTGSASNDANQEDFKCDVCVEAVVGMNGQAVNIGPVKNDVQVQKCVEGVSCLEKR